MTRRTILAASLVALSTSFFTPDARADAAASCKEGYDGSQIARDGGKLLQARKLLTQCMSPTCSSFVQKDCAGWLTDVEARLPSVILAAKDGDGTDLVDVSVAIDGAAGPTKLDGRALDLDPGEHTFVFRRPDGKEATQHMLVREREKGRTVLAVIGEPTQRGAAPGAQPAQSRSMLRPAGFIVGGVGIAGIATGAVFGFVAQSKLSAPQCDTSAKVCDPGVISSARTAATVSTIGFIAGGVLLAGGVTMVLLAPKEKDAAHPEPRAARLQLTPTAGPNAGGFSLEGAW